MNRIINGSSKRKFFPFKVDYLFERFHRPEKFEISLFEKMAVKLLQLPIHFKGLCRLCPIFNYLEYYALLQLVCQSKVMACDSLVFCLLFAFNLQTVPKPFQTTVRQYYRCQIKNMVNNKGQDETNIFYIYLID